MPNVRASSATIGTMRGAELLVAQQQVDAAHERHRGGDLALAGALGDLLERGQLRRLQLRRGSCADAAAGSRRAPCAAPACTALPANPCPGGSTARRRACRRRSESGSGRGNARTDFVVQLLLLMGRVLRFAGRAHAVTLDRLGQDHGRHALGVRRRVIGRIHLVRIVAAAIQAPDVVVGEIGDHLARLRILAEEMLARVRAAERLAGLVFAVDGFHHQLAQHAAWCRARAADPSSCPRPA